MECLFSPSTRYRDFLESRGRLEQFRRRHQPWQELHLDVSTEEFLSAERAFTYVGLYAMLGNQNAVAWLTPHAAVAREGGLVTRWYTYHRFTFTADGKIIVALASSTERLLEICDVVVGLLAASVVYSVSLRDCSELHYDALSSAPSLAHLMKQCQSLKVLTLNDLEMNENLFRILGDFSQTS
jgi:hypothetical protein